MKKPASEHYFTAQPTSDGETSRLDIEFAGRHWRFETAGGVFSKSEVDEGSLLLARTALKEARPEDVLCDLGCGWGFLGVVLAPLVKEVWLTDVNQRAVELTRASLALNNLTNASVVESDILAGLPAEVGPTLIVTNPPFRAGKAVVWEFLRQAHERLAPGGRLLVVVRKRQGADSLKAELARLFGAAETLARHKGFHVQRAIK